jgi:hypothetical protein
MNPNLSILLRSLNAALEHVPLETKAILVEVAQPAVKALEEALKDKPE